MNQTVKVIGLVLLAVLAFSAVAASAASASAPRWKVAGAFLAAEKTKTFTSTSTTVVTLKSAGLNLTSPFGKCTAHGTIVGGGATLPGTATYTLICSEVKVIGSEGKCVVKSPGQVAGTIKTESLKGTLVWLQEKQEEQAAGLKIAADIAAYLFKYEVSGAECPVANVKPYLVIGEIISSALPIAEEVEVGSLKFPEPPFFTWWSNATPRVKQSIEANRLKFGKEGAAPVNTTFVGTFGLDLEPKEKVGVFAG